MLSVWVVHKALYLRAITLSDTLLSSYSQEQQSTAAPVYIEIEDIISLPVVTAGYVGGAWMVSNTSANYVSASASPGANGNIIIYAHNKPRLFGPLQRLKGGEKVRIRTSDGAVYRYQVVFARDVSPSDTRLLTPTATEILTLYTCSGFFDSKRLVVRAVPLPL